MIAINNLYLFFIASLLLNVTPGNDMIFVASRTISQGSKAGYLSALGIFVGCFVHILAAVFGLSVIIAQSALLFETIKYAGAAYLIYLGIKMMITKPNENIYITEISFQRKSKIFQQGVLTNALNPKVAIFFLSFLPQFVNASSPYVKMQFLLLGMWFAVQGTLVLLAVAFLLGRTTNFLKYNPAFWLCQERITGLVLVTLGVKLAIISRK
ncbi:MAG TPA: LysE family translocator [Cyclobacteriaceae bacterium]|nr:LysE family translocator [Cyclobacteriaceae bacterium]